MNLFYAPDILGQNYEMPEEESKHVVRVLRLKPGDILHLTDGRGNLFTARLIDDHPKRCLLTVTDIKTGVGKRNYSISIAIAPTKNIDRFEWFLEKSTEIGIDNIFPIICSRSERKVIKADRSKRVITAAMKQSLKAYHPTLHEQQNFKQFMALEHSEEKFIAHCMEDDKSNLQTLVKKGSNTIVMIGPEGDFTEEEVKFALSSGFKPVSLGESRLRTETAGIVACHTLALLNQ